MIDLRPWRAAFQRVERGPGVVGRQQRVIFVRVDADRKGPGAHPPAADRYHAVGLDRPAQLALDIMVEALEPFLGLEADQVIVEHRFDQPAMERKRGDQPVRRPRNVEEEAEPVGDPHAPQALAERDQMIVVDPNQIALGDQRGDGRRDPVVDPLIARSEQAIELGQVDPVMEQRP